MSQSGAFHTVAGYGLPPNVTTGGVGMVSRQNVLTNFFFSDVLVMTGIVIVSISSDIPAACTVLVVVSVTVEVMTSVTVEVIVAVLSRPFVAYGPRTPPPELVGCGKTVMVVECSNSGKS